MMLAHVRPTLISTERGRREERGYVMVTFALLLIPLLLMVGLSVDVGSWYSRASDIQKAADAAALAGVVWLPDVTAAQKYALEAAERNGFKTGVDNITVSAVAVAGEARRLRVTIADAKVGSIFYGSFGGKNIKLSRSSTAEYVLPVPLGSPENQFGGVEGKSDPVGTDAPGLWGNIHGVQTDNISGDGFAARCRSGANCGTSGNPPNPDYRTTGYLYTVDVPAGGVTGFDLQIYDAVLAPRSAETVDTGDTNYNGASDSRKTTTTWTFYNADSSELDVNDNPIATSTLCTSSPGVAWTTGGQASWRIAENASDTNWKNKWVSLCKRTTSLPQGRYVLRVQTSGSGNGANRYAVRALASSTVKPRVSAYGDMSMYNNIADDTASFYLAEIAPEHKGKTIELNLYDPGEVSGTGKLSVVNNYGVVAPTCTPSSDASGSGITNDVPISPCTITTAVSGSPRFNGEYVTLLIPIPTTYNCTVGSLATSGAGVGCWWKIKYDITGTANDTTTWAAKVIGDPVHLVE